MFKKLNRVFGFVSFVQLFFVVLVFQSEARNLTDVLGEGFSFRAPPGGVFRLKSDQLENLADFSKIGRAIAPAFSAAISQAVAQEFPLASVAPAFTYRFNSAVDAYQRLTGVPGPLFSERALTLGKGQFNFSIGYSFFDYTSVNGVDLNNIKSPGFILDGSLEEPTPIRQLPGGEVLLAFPLSFSQIRTRIDLNAHVIAPTFRYGITDRWDTSLALPIVNTFLKVRNTTVRVVDIATFLVVGPEGAKTVDAAGNIIDPLSLSPEELARKFFQFTKSRRPPASLSKASGSATGIGDLTLRTKYQFWQNGFGGGAFGLNLQLPTGNTRNFHGTGQTHILTFLYLSQILAERFEPHLNVGIDFNADDVDRNSFLYALGGTLLVGRKIGVIVDFLGRSEFGKISMRVPQADKIIGRIFDRSPKDCTLEHTCSINGEVPFSVFPVRFKRNNIINFSFGLRYTLGTSGSIFFGGIVPLNNDGFRADFVPSGGIEYMF